MSANFFLKCKLGRRKYSIKAWVVGLGGKQNIKASGKKSKGREEKQKLWKEEKCEKNQGGTTSWRLLVQKYHTAKIHFYRHRWCICSYRWCRQRQLVWCFQPISLSNDDPWTPPYPHTLFHLFMFTSLLPTNCFYLSLLRFLPTLFHLYCFT